jgi:hypothetical protein
LAGYRASYAYLVIATQAQRIQASDYHVSVSFTPSFVLFISETVKRLLLIAYHHFDIPFPRAQSAMRIPLDGFSSQAGNRSGCRESSAAAMILVKLSGYYPFADPSA